MSILYNGGIALYRKLVGVAALKSKKAALLHAGEQQVFEQLARELDAKGGYTWFHAASLGEFEQGRPLMEAMRATHPDCKILLTFYSPSGYEVRKNYEGADVVCYLPFDTPSRVRRFLDMVKPCQAIFIKYEFWANYLHELSKRAIPTYLVSGIFRPKQVFFRWYGSFFRKQLHCFTHLYVQDEASISLLSSIGVTHATVAGDTRFDRVLDIQRAAKPLPLVETFTQDVPTLVAGSSWSPDEDILLPYINKRTDVKLIIAPHEIHEAHLQAIEAKIARPYVRYTQATPQQVAAASVLLIDCFGLLSSIYRYGQIAYIGGGFGVGIHNITEAAVYGIPVIFGSNYAKFKEAVDLVANGGAISVANGEELHTQLDALLGDSALLQQRGSISGSYIAENAGAADTILPQLCGNI